MMLKEKSSPWARLKYLYVLPVAAIAVTAFARPEVSDKVEKISSVKVNDLAAIVETKVGSDTKLSRMADNRCNHKSEKTTIFTDISFVSVIISRIVDG